MVVRAARTTASEATRAARDRTASDAGETRWLTAPQQRAWRAYLEATLLLFDTFDRQLQRDADIPHGYYEILVRLSEAPNRALRMSELADATRSSRSRLSHAIARLAERGWVRRFECATDRRGQIAELTDAGFAALAGAAPGHVATVRENLIGLLRPEQISQLEQIFDTIIEHFTAAAHPPGDDGRR